jgi:PAS domain S-box-containing protein
MTPELANFAGNVHGGHILRLVDEIAYACACSYSAKYCVTLSVDRVLFKHPVRVGELLSMHAQVNYTGRTSMQVGVRVEAKDLRNGITRHTNSCFFTMVAMEDGKPSEVPTLVPRTEHDKLRWMRAEMARDHSRAVERIATQVGDFLTIVDLAAAPMLLIDKETGIVRLANKRAVELLGYPALELMNRAVWDLHAPDEREKVRALFEQVAIHNFTEPFTFKHVRGDGATVDIEAVSWVIPLPSRPLIQRLMRQIEG